MQVLLLLLALVSVALLPPAQAQSGTECTGTFLGVFCITVETLADCTVTVNLVYDEETELIPGTEFDFADGAICIETQDVAGVETICIVLENVEVVDEMASGCFDLTVEGLVDFDVPVFCFENSTIIDECFLNCPNDCSGNGNCLEGECTCDAGWDGDDCSNDLTKFRACQDIEFDILGTTFDLEPCILIDFTPCNLTSTLSIGSAEVFSFTVDIPDIDAEGGAQITASIPLLPCDVTFEINDWTETDAGATGCAEIGIDCGTTAAGPWELGCFTDVEALLPCEYCTQGCVNGVCESGECDCIDGYSGESCEEALCPLLCSGQGTCVDGECECNEGFEGVGCETVTINTGGDSVLDSSSSEETGSSFPVWAIVIVVLLVILILLGAAALIFFMLRKGLKSNDKPTPLKEEDYIEDSE